MFGCFKLEKTVGGPRPLERNGLNTFIYCFIKEESKNNILSNLYVNIIDYNENRTAQTYPQEHRGGLYEKNI